MNIGGSISGALFSEGHKYRFALWRIWDRTKPDLLFVGLNPSTAAQHRDDPTVIMLACLAKNLKFGGIYVANLKPIVSAHPEILLTEVANQHLAENDEAIKRMQDITTITLVGWGEFGRKLGSRPVEVLAILEEPVYCLKVNRSGEPTHPLYLSRNSKLIQYSRKVEVKLCQN